MKKWFDYTIKERIEINKQQGFTIDTLYPEGTERRKEWDKMVQETLNTLENIQTTIQKSKEIKK